VASRVDRVRVGSTSKDAQKVVGGAAIGAVAGQVLGRDTKSTVIGAAVGAAAGAAAAGASARYDMCVPTGAPIQVTLRDALNLRV
jgi:outer membrane lipoprotein SlyB